MSKTDVSIVICTRNRPESLQETLGCLERSRLGDARIALNVVDNCSRDGTRKVVESFSDRLPIRYLIEEHAGKSYALNRALDEGDMGAIIAFLDDDIAVRKEWMAGVRAITSRNPDYDFFTGRTLVRWPATDIPVWARNGTLANWAFSGMDWARADTPIRQGRWAPGGHFWLRRSVIDAGYRFPNVWATEPRFMLKLTEDGYRGLMGPDAVVEHRVQQELLDRGVIRRRAILAGRETASALVRFPNVTRPGRLLARHPIGYHLICLCALTYWRLKYSLSWRKRDSEDGFASYINALERSSFFGELLRVGSEVRAGWRNQDRS